MSGSSTSRMRRTDVRLLRGDVVAGRSECDGAHLVRRQELGERLPDARIVVHDEDDMVSYRHGAPFRVDWQLSGHYAWPEDAVRRSGAAIVIPDLGRVQRRFDHRPALSGCG